MTFPDQFEPYFVVHLKAYAFETEDQARIVADKLLDAFCDLPEAEGYGASTHVRQESEDDELNRIFDERSGGPFKRVTLDELIPSQRSKDRDITETGLIARLRERGGRIPTAAAARIEALVSENRALKRLNEAQSKMLDAEETRADRLDLAVEYILDGMGISYPDYEIDAEDDFLDVANSKWVRDTLTRLAEAMRGNDDAR